MDPKMYMPFTRGSYPFVPWGLWVESGGQMHGARRPEGPAMEQVQLYRQLRGTTDRAEQDAFMRQILQIAADEFYTMGIASGGSGYAVVRDGFHNVPDTLNFAWKLGTPAAYNPSQFYIDRSTP
jgi:peptide/nickel transport system substrate-binding protein